MLPAFVAEIGNYHYGQGHPMKPHRVRMTHNLVVNYGLYREMEVFRPKPVSRDQMTRFHSDDYINFLRVINPDNMSEFLRHLQRCKPRTLLWQTAMRVCVEGGFLLDTMYIVDFPLR